MSTIADFEPAAGGAWETILDFTVNSASTIVEMVADFTTHTNHKLIVSDWSSGVNIAVALQVKIGGVWMTDAAYHSTSLKRYADSTTNNISNIAVDTEMEVGTIKTVGANSTTNKEFSLVGVLAGNIFALSGYSLCTAASEERNDIYAQYTGNTGEVEGIRFIDHYAGNYNITGSGRFMLIGVKK